jgi:hypothetical protein
MHRSVETELLYNQKRVRRELERQGAPGGVEAVRRDTRLRVWLEAGAVWLVSTGAIIAGFYFAHR